MKSRNSLFCLSFQFFYLPKKLFCLSILPLMCCFGCAAKVGKTAETNNLPIIAENKNLSRNLLTEEILR